MNLSSLQTFLAIVETGHLNRAAERLHVTQSTVTARLNALESDIGQALFHRRKSGAQLTSAGFKFERYAQLMTDLWRQARQETSLPTAVETVCNLGCHPDLWPGLGRTLFERIRRGRANIAMSAWPGVQSELDRWLATGLVDIAICYTPVPRENLTLYSLQNDRLVLVSTTARALMRRDPSYIYVDGGEEFRKAHAVAYPDGDTPTLTFGSPIWTLDHLLTTGGSAYLPIRIAQPHIDRKRLHVMPGAPEFSRRTHLAVHNRTIEKWPWLATLAEEQSADSAQPGR